MNHNPVKSLLRYTVLAVCIVFFLLPIPWLIITALNAKGQIFYGDFQPSLNNFIQVFKNIRFVKSFLNSVIIAFSTALFTSIISLFSAYSLSRLKLPFNKVFLGLLAFTLFLPFTSLMVPIYSFLLMVGLTDSIAAVVIVITTFELPFYIWFMKAVMDSIPGHLEEMAKLDQCTFPEIILKVILPYVKESLYIVFLLTFVEAWNELTVPFMLLTDNSKYPASIMVLSFLKGASVSKNTLYSPGMLAAFSIYYSLPAVIIYCFSRRFMSKSAFKNLF